MADRVVCDGSGNVGVSDLVIGINESIPFAGGTLTGPTRGNEVIEDMVIDFNGGNNFKIVATGAVSTPVVPVEAVGQSGVIVIESAENVSGWDSVFKFKKVLPALSGIECFAYYIYEVDYIIVGRVS